MLNVTYKFDGFSVTKTSSMAFASPLSVNECLLAMFRILSP